MDRTSDVTVDVLVILPYIDEGMALDEYLFEGVDVDLRDVVHGSSFDSELDH